MDPRERRVVAALGALVGVIALVVAILALTGGDDDGDDVATSRTTTTSSTTTTATTSTTTTTAPAGPTTTAAARPPTTAATAPAPPPPARPTLVLEGDGIGPFEFGTDADTLVGRLTALLGQPDEDSGFVAATSRFGVCPGTQVRGVRWKSLRVLLTDGPSEFGPSGRRHFFAYVDTPFSFDGAPVDSLDLTTAEGVGIGSTVAQLRAAYGDKVDVDDDEIFGATYSVELRSGPITGDLSGTGGNDVVESVRGGAGCGE